MSQRLWYFLVLNPEISEILIDSQQTILQVWRDSHSKLGTACCYQQAGACASAMPVADVGVAIFGVASMEMKHRFFFKYHDNYISWYNYVLHQAVDQTAPADEAQTDRTGQPGLGHRTSNSGP